MADEKFNLDEVVDGILSSEERLRQEIQNTAVLLERADDARQTLEHRFGALWGKATIAKMAMQKGMGLSDKLLQYAFYNYGLGAKLVIPGLTAFTKLLDENAGKAFLIDWPATKLSNSEGETVSFEPRKVYAGLFSEKPHILGKEELRFNISETKLAVREFIRYPSNADFVLDEASFDSDWGVPKELPTGKFLDGFISDKINMLNQNDSRLNAPGDSGFISLSSFISPISIDKGEGISVVKIFHSDEEVEGGRLSYMRSPQDMVLGEWAKVKDYFDKLYLKKASFVYGSPGATLVPLDAPNFLF